MNDKSRHQKSKETSNQRNEGEGNKTAARQYNRAQRQFVRGRQVDEQARAAEKALDSAQRSELEDAGLVGKSHAAAEDPAVKGH